ncbi:MAG: hypothetical protein OXQ27_06520 [Chloroflexota bacterium]|nr:hypothetical protein [Chloroflexota bacterium]
MIRPGLVTRALALCSLISLFSLGCSSLPSTVPPVQAPESVADQADDRIGQISRDVIRVLRHLNINNLAFARQSLTPGKYRVALDFLIPEIQLLAQQVVEVNAGGTEAAPAALLSAVDPLARAAAEFRRYIETEQDAALAAAYSQLSEAHVQLEHFLANSALAEGPTLQELLLQAGRVEIEAEPIAVSRVVLGPFANMEDAKTVQEAAATYNAVIRQDELPSVWLGPFRVTAEAGAVAAQWRELKVPAAVHEDTVYEFRATEVSPVQGRTWRELAWFHDMEIAAHFIAVSPEGNVVLAGDTSGTIQRRTGQGEHFWTQSFALPTYALAVTREGGAIFAAGIGAHALSGDGARLWRDSLEEYEVILERAAISNDGRTMVAATSNAEGLGRAFGFNESGLAWSTSVEYHAIPGLNSFHLSPDGDRVALGGNGQGRYQVMVVNERGEKIMGSDFIEPVVDVALAGLNQKVVVLTERHVSQFDIASQQIEWQASARGRALAVSQPGDIIYVGGVQGITAFYQDGRRLWTQDAMPVSQIVANYNYLIGLSKNIRLVVVKYDGSILGTVSPLVPIRDFAVATDGDLLIALDEENRLSVWRLPPPATE